jgi:hypothetical protein
METLSDGWDKAMIARLGSKVLLRLWNPVGATDKSGNTIRDIRRRRRSKRISAEIKRLRAENGEPERQVTQMFSLQAIGFFRRWRLRKIAKQVRAGIVPEGVDQETIFEALKQTRPGGTLEAFGFLSYKVFDKHGTLKQACPVAGVKEVTVEFTKHLADAMCSSGTPMDNFNAHGMGDGSTAETDTQTALVNQQDGRNVGSQTHGATSNIYKSVATIVATDAYTAIEHGIFDTTGAASDVMLDRTIGWVSTEPGHGR